MAEISSDVKKERRRFIRHTCKVYIEMIVRCSDGFTGTVSTNRIEVKGRMLDLSASGCRIFTKQSFVEGQELRLIILIPDRPKIMSNGNVHWSKVMEKPDGFASGVHFVNMPEKGKEIIRGFLKPFLNGAAEEAEEAEED